MNSVSAKPQPNISSFISTNHLYSTSYTKIGNNNLTNPTVGSSDAPIAVKFRMQKWNELAENERPNPKFTVKSETALKRENSLIRTQFNKKSDALNALEADLTRGDALRNLLSNQTGNVSSKTQSSDRVLLNASQGQADEAAKFGIRSHKLNDELNGALLTNRKRMKRNPSEETDFSLEDENDVERIECAQQTGERLDRLANKQNLLALPNLDHKLIKRIDQPRCNSNQILKLIKPLNSHDFASQTVGHFKSTDINQQTNRFNRINQINDFKRFNQQATEPNDDQCGHLKSDEISKSSKHHLDDDLLDDLKVNSKSRGNQSTQHNRPNFKRSVSDLSNVILKKSSLLRSVNEQTGYRTNFHLKNHRINHLVRPDSRLIDEQLKSDASFESGKFWVSFKTYHVIRNSVGVCT